MKNILITIAAVLLVGCGESETEPPLFQAIENENIKNLKKTITDGASLAVPYQGALALNLAIEKGNKEIIEILLKNGANINAKDDAKITPLHEAVYSKAIEIVRILIQNGADINAKNDAGEIPLHHAVYYGYRDIGELLISNGSDINTKDNLGNTVLHEAAAQGRSEFVEILIQNGANINAKTDRGLTPLHMASNKEIVKFLIDAGSDINSRSRKGTPIELSEYNNDEIYNLLKMLDAKTTRELDELLYETREAERIQGIIKKGNFESIKNNLESLKDFNIKNKYGETPLHFATRHSYKEIIELIIKKGADINSKDEAGFTSLDMAKIIGNSEIIDLLLKHSGKTGDELRAEEK